MRKNAILKHAITTAILGGSILSSSASWAASCFANSAGNWSTVAWSGTGCASGPAAADHTTISATSISLNGVPINVGSVTVSFGGALDDAGATGSSITTGYILLGGGSAGFTQNTPITITGDNPSSSQGALDYYGGAAKSFATNGNLSFTGTGQIIGVPTGQSLNIVGTSGTPVQLSTTNTVDLQGAGTYTINYVYFAAGTWTDNTTGTFNISNCTVAGGATVPAGWGCTAPSSPTSASVNLLPSNKPIWFAKDLE